VCGDSEVWAIAKSRNKTEYLIQKVKEVMWSFNRDTMAKACESLRSRIYAFVNADGSFSACCGKGDRNESTNVLLSKFFIGTKPKEGGVLHAIPNNM
jgi:hypothetical protein